MIELIESKAAGEEIAVQPAEEEPAEVPDLMAALEASLASVRSDDADADGDGDGAKPKKGAASNGRSASGAKGKGKSGSGSKAKTGAKS